MPKNTLKIEISYKTIIFTIGFLLTLSFLFFIRDIIFLLFISLLLMSALNPIVTKLEGSKIPRPVGIIILYIAIVSLFSAIMIGIIPALLQQTNSLISQFSIPSEIWSNIQSLKVNLQDIQVILNQINNIPQLINTVSSAFSGVLAVVTVAMITFYLLLERSKLHRHLSLFFNDRKVEKRIENTINSIETQIGSWFQGQLILMLVIGILTYIGLILLNIEYALPLALLAGLLEIVPSLGPTIASIPAILVAYFTFNPGMALAVGALYVLIQQFENNLIVPMVMRRSVGLNPIITILLLLTGLKLYGVIGAISAIPIYIVTKIIFSEFIKEHPLSVE